MTNTTSQYPDTLHHDDGSHRNTFPEVTEPGIFEEMKRRHLREHIDQDNAVRDLYKQLAATLTQLAQAGEAIKVIDRDLNPLTLPDGSPLILGSGAAYILQGATGGIGYYPDLKAWAFGSDIQGLPKTATVTAEHLTSLMNANAPFAALLFSFGSPGNLWLWDSDEPFRSPGSPVVLRRSELIKIYDEAADEEYPDGALGAAQRIIDEALAKIK